MRCLRPGAFARAVQGPGLVWDTTECTMSGARHMVTCSPTGRGRMCRYLHFDLFENDLFLLGTRVFRQRRGVAIGGMLSAQCASLYCMYKEFQWLSAHGGSGAWARIPGLLAQPFRFRDNIVRKSHYLVFLGGLDPGQAPFKTLLLMLRLT